MRSNGEAPRTATLAMIVLTTTVVAAGCAPLFQQTVRGSGEIDTRGIDLGDVSEVRVGSALDVDIVPGYEPTVTIEADDNVLDRIEVTEQGRRVELRLERGIRLRSATVDITVTLPSVTQVRTSGASNVDVTDGLEMDNLRVAASGASNIRGAIDAALLDVSASGSSDVSLTGSAEQLAASASGASDVDLRQVQVAGDGDVEASGASDVGVHVSGTLRANASGASGVRYAGSPGDVTTRISGASSVEPGN